MKPQPETLRRTWLTRHTTPAEIRTRTHRLARMLPQTIADQVGCTTVEVSVLAQPYREWDAEELAVMDAVVHWFGD